MTNWHKKVTKRLDKLINIVELNAENTQEVEVHRLLINAWSLMQSRGL